jgi:hypothetical protein
VEQQGGRLAGAPHTPNPTCSSSSRVGPRAEGLQQQAQVTWVCPLWW